MDTANVTLKHLKRSLPTFFVMNSLRNKTTPYLWEHELPRYKFYQV